MLLEKALFLFEVEAKKKNLIPADGKEEIPRPGTYGLDADEGVEEEEGDEEKEKGYNADTDELEGHYEAEYAEVDPEYELTNEPNLNEGGISDQTKLGDPPNTLPEEGNGRTENGEKDVSALESLKERIEETKKFIEMEREYAKKSIPKVSEKNDVSERKPIKETNKTGQLQLFKKVFQA
ncbi:neurofilament medium polypeptide-like [Homalodisca vitripennis]|uniref:neurofilament medium polypeptide-like n=1 Tax=Homalodisca vitripennis TaxID=197043 RepID=UPI001EEA87F1|nr:neurofilament medium polypeptide-like [Homalodisca vitripennis]